MTRAAPRRRAEKPRRRRRSGEPITSRARDARVGAPRNGAPVDGTVDITGDGTGDGAAAPLTASRASRSSATSAAGTSHAAAGRATESCIPPAASGAAGVAELIAAEPRSVEGPGPRSGLVEGLRIGTLVSLWLVVLAAGLAGLGAKVVGVGPPWVGEAGAVAVSTAYAWALAARTGARSAVLALFALAVGAGVVALDNAQLRTGAAVLAAALGAALGVMATVPARRFVAVVRESVVAVVIAGIGGLAALGFEPVLSVARFQYAVLACSLGCAFFLVYRLGAGLHGLGRRGVLVVAVGGAMLVVTLFYAEMIRRYGTAELVDGIHDGLAWCRTNLGGYPRPIEALLGIPALAWGTHMRARRRQGWWVCLFGVALTAPVAATLANPDLGAIEAGLTVAYSLVVGLVIGLVVIRVDVALTGGHHANLRSRAGRRAAREADDASAVRPEPRRVSALL